MKDGKDIKDSKDESWRACWLSFGSLTSFRSFLSLPRTTPRAG